MASLGKQLSRGGVARTARAPSLLFASVLGLAAGGCVEPLDTSRVVPARGSLGEEVYRVLCERLAAEDDPSDVSGEKTLALCSGEVGAEAAPSERLRALAAQRNTLVDALDRVMPPSLHDDLEDALVQMLPLYDAPAERLPRAARAFGDALARTATDDEALSAVERMRARDGYRPLVQAIGLVRPLLAYEGFDRFAERTLRTLVTDPAASAAWQDLLRASSLALAASAVEPETPGDPSTYRVARDLLLGTRPGLGVPLPNPITRRDARGLALVRPRFYGLPTPFVDMDRDGLADADAAGRFVDAAGELVSAPAPFRTPGVYPATMDEFERPIAEDGLPYYEYFDANQTLLAGLLREVHTLSDPAAPAALDLASGIPWVLGPRAPRSSTFGAAPFTYVGFDTAASPLLDLVHAYGAVLSAPESDEVHLVVRRLFEEHEDVAAALIESGLRIDAYADGREAGLAANSKLWDDVIRVARWMAAEPGLTEAVLRALADPYTARLGKVVAEFMRHRDFVAPLAVDPNRTLFDATIADPVDRALPNVHENQSLFQRVAAVIHDFDQAQVCNKEGAQIGVTAPALGFVTLPLHFEECGLVKIDNMARMFAQSVIGRAQIPVADSRIQAIGNATASLGLGFLTIDQIFQRESKITGLDTSPTPGALARMAFLPQNKFMTNLFGVVRTRDGVPVSPRHDATLFACEKKYRFADGRFPQEASFYDAISPMLRAFDDFDRGLYGEHVGPGTPSERFIFGEFISALHLHWPSGTTDFTQNQDPTAPSYTTFDGAHTYEDILAYAMDDADLVLRLHELARTLDTMQVRPGVDGIDVLARGVEVLLRPLADDGLTRRDGGTTTVENDGVTRVEATRLHLFLDALNGVDRAFEDPAADLPRWRRGRSGLVDALFATERVGAVPVLQNRRTVPLLVTALRFVEERTRAHAADREAWATGLAARLEATVDDPVVSALLVLLDTIQADDASVAEFGALLAHLTDASAADPAFSTTAATGVDLFQLLDDETNTVPLLHLASRFVAPNATEVVASGGTPDLNHGAVGLSVELLADLQAYDRKRVLLEVLRRLVAIEPITGRTDLEVITDALLEVHRATPGAGTPLTRADDVALLGRSADFLGNDEHGLARLFDIISARKRP